MPGDLADRDRVMIIIIIYYFIVHSMYTRRVLGQYAKTRYDRVV